MAIVLCGGAVLACGGTAAAWWWFARESLPPVPLLADYGHLDADTVREIQEAAKRVTENPLDGSTWRELGMMYQANLLLDLAGTCYQRAMTLDGEDVRSAYHFAMLHASMGDLDAAVAVMRRAAELALHYGPAHWRLGLWLLDLDRPEEALIAFQTAVAIEPHSEPANIGLARAHLQLGDPRLAVTILERMFQRAVANEGYAQYLLATAYQRLGHAEGVRAILSRPRPTTPLFTDPWELEAFRYSKLIAIQLDYARFLSSQGRLNEAIERLAALAPHRPDDPSVLVTLSICLREHGKLDEAAAALEEVLRFRPESHFARTHLALTRLGQSRRASGAQALRLLHEALEECNLALETNPGFGVAYGVRGDVLMALGRREEAVEAFLVAAQMELDGTAWLLRAARAQLDLHQWAQAIETCRTIVRARPGHDEGWFLLGLGQLNNGMWAEAEASLREAERFGFDKSRTRHALEQLTARRSASPRGPPTINERP